MDLKETIENQYKATILNLTHEEKELYIKQLAKEYYSYFFSNNPEAFERTLNNIKLVEGLGIGVNTIAFIDYCLLNEINSILNKNVNPEIALESFEIGLEKTLQQKFKDYAKENGFHEANIKRYDLIIMADKLQQENKTLQEHKELLIKMLSSKELEPSEVAVINELEAYEQTNFKRIVEED